MTLRQTRGAECVSDFAIDRMLADDAASEEAAAISMHATHCTRCASRIFQFREAQKTFETVPRALWIRPRTRERRRGLAGVGVVLASAAALLLFVQFSEKTERSKGSAHVTVHIQHHGAVRKMVNDDERLEPGDAIEFTYDASEDGYLAIVSVDSAGANVYFSDGDHAARIERGREVLLPRSVVLDETLGVETIWAAFCRESVATERVLRAVKSHSSGAVSDDVCVFDRHVFTKAKP